MCTAESKTTAAPADFSSSSDSSSCAHAPLDDRTLNSASNVTRAHSRDHTHYKSVHYFLMRLKNQVSDFAGLFFADSSSTSCSRGLRRQIATNERHIGVSPLQLYKNGNFNLVITLLTLFPLNFAVYLRKLHVAPYLQTGVSFIVRKNGSSSLHAMELRRIEKLINLTIAVSVVCCSRISRLDT